MAVTIESVLQVAIGLVPLALGGAPLSMLELAAVSGLSGLLSPADVEAAAKEAARLVFGLATWAAKHGGKATGGDPDIGGNDRAPSTGDVILHPEPEDDDVW